MYPLRLRLKGLLPFLLPEGIGESSSSDLMSHAALISFHMTDRHSFSFSCLRGILFNCKSEQHFSKVFVPGLRSWAGPKALQAY